jgi:hypothetical protein
MDDMKDDDIKEVMHGESRRGKRPIDLTARKAERQKLADLRILLRIPTEREFRETMLAYGLAEDSPAFFERACCLARVSRLVAFS